VWVPKAPNSEGCTTARVHYTNVTLLLLHGLAQQAIFVKQLRDAFAAFTFVPQEANEVASVASQSHSQLVLAISRRRTMGDDHREKTLRFWCGFN
jgi:hypothetical protein